MLGMEVTGDDGSVEDPENQEDILMMAVADTVPNSMRDT